MKKTIWILLLLTLLQAAVACNPETVEESLSGISNGQPTSIAISLPDSNQKGLSSVYDGGIDFNDGNIYIDIGYKAIRKWKDGKYEDIELQHDVPEHDQVFRSGLWSMYIFIKDDYVYQNGWIDYNSIYREHLSGDRKRTKLCEGRLITVKDDWVWWYNAKNDTLGKIRTNGSDNQNVKENLFDDTEKAERAEDAPRAYIALLEDDYLLLENQERLYNGFLYETGYHDYTKYDMNKQIVFSHELPENTRSVCSWNGWIFYYIKDNIDDKICAFPETGEVKDSITIKSISPQETPMDTFVSRMEVIDGWLYYDEHLPLKGYHRVRVDGTGEEQLW